MNILPSITDQTASVGLPLYAVTLTAVPRSDTPVLLMLHWHGFRREMLVNLPEIFSPWLPVPGSALQLNERWSELEHLDVAMLDAGWQLGAWDVQREERRGCNYIGASEQEAMECRQAFGEHPLGDELHVLAEAPDRSELMQLGAAVGYVRWQFRPVLGGIWHSVSDDVTLGPDGSREPPCPVLPEKARGGRASRASRTCYRLGCVNRIILPG